MLVQHLAYRPRFKLPYSIVLVYPRRLDAEDLAAPDEDTREGENEQPNSTYRVEDVGHSNG